MKMTEINDLSDVELKQKELSLRSELSALRLKKQIGQIEKSHRFSEFRRDIARIMFTKTKRSGEVFYE